MMTGTVVTLILDIRRPTKLNYSSGAITFSQGSLFFPNFLPLLTWSHDWPGVTPSLDQRWCHHWPVMWLIWCHRIWFIHISFFPHNSKGLVPIHCLDPMTCGLFVKLTTFGAILRGRGEPQLLLCHLSARPTYNQVHLRQNQVHMRQNQVHLRQNQVHLRQTKLISDKTKLLWRSQVQLRQNLVHMTKPSSTERKQSLIWGQDETGIHLPTRLNTCLRFKWEARQVW